MRFIALTLLSFCTIQSHAKSTELGLSFGIVKPVRTEGGASFTKRGGTSFTFNTDFNFGRNNAKVYFTLGTRIGSFSAFLTENNPYPHNTKINVFYMAAAPGMHGAFSVSRLIKLRLGVNSVFSAIELIGLSGYMGVFPVDIGFNMGGEAYTGVQIGRVVSIGLKGYLPYKAYMSTYENEYYKISNNRYRISSLMLDLRFRVPARKSRMHDEYDVEE